MARPLIINSAKVPVNTGKLYCSKQKVSGKRDRRFRAHAAIEAVLEKSHELVDGKKKTDG